MTIRHAYSATNKLSGLAAAAFTWSTAVTTNRTYVNDGRMDKVFSAGSSSGGANVIIDLGSAKAVTAVATLNTNIASATAPTLKVEGADDAGISSNVVAAKAVTTLGTTQPRHKDHVLQFDSVSKRYWRLTWTWTGSFTLTLGEIFFAATTTLNRGVIFGHGEREEFITTRFAGDSGERRGHYVAGPYRIRRFPFADLTESERDEVLTMFRASYGGATNMLWCSRYEAGTSAATAAYQDCIYGRLEQSSVGWTETDPDIYQPDAFELRSAAREVGA